MPKKGAGTDYTRELVEWLVVEAGMWLGGIVALGLLFAVGYGSVVRGLLISGTGFVVVAVVWAIRKKW